MTAGEATVVFLLQTLKEELRNYSDLREGAQRELDLLQDELRLLQRFLEDSTKKIEKNRTFKEFEKQIRELVFEVEDIVDFCLAKSAAAKTTKNFITRSFRKRSINLAKQVKILREQRVSPITDGIRSEFGKQVFDPYKFITEICKGESSCQSPIVRIPEQDQPYRYSHDKIVDFRDEAEVIGYLMESRNCLDVISITGMPGLGKSTFALKIFEHEAVAAEFPLRIWIPVSEMSSSKDVFLNILEHFTPKKSSSTQSAADIVRTVHACLENKKWLLVMDNVTTTEEWDELRQILPTRNSMAKVLLTTRENKIAEHARVYTNPHKLNILGKTESLELLRLQVFNNPEDHFPPELQEIGQIIAEKCGGVPLLILVIGGYLKGIFTRTRELTPVIEEWSNAARNMGKIITEDKTKSISDALEKSYNILAHDLRECFLYMGLFPKNQEILASTLTKLWIAEGFIQGTDRQSVEEIANEVLDDLINKNLVSVAKKNLEQVKTCRVHELIRGFCINKAKDDKFFRVIQPSTEGAPEPPVSELTGFRRVCLHSNPSRFLSGNPNGPRVHSFLCFFEEPFDLNPTHMSTIPKAFKFLRVLSCKSLKFGKFPKVRNLILLKHITLFIGDLNVLPQEISKLLRLQTLIVDTTSHTINVEANMSEMIQLKCLKTKAAISLKDENWKGTTASENLVTMSRLSPKSCTRALSSRAPNLKTLGIRGKIAEVDFQTFSLDAFHHLQKLKIVSDSVPSDNSLIDHLSRLDCFPPHLVSLTLSNTYLKWGKHMLTLANISTLKFLKLKDNAFTGSIWDTGECSGFPDLQFLLIQNSQLAIWKTSDAYFLSLRCLVIKNCQSLERIPQSLATKLEKLEIESVRLSVADSARKIESNKKQTEQRQKAKWENGPFNLTVGPKCDL